MRGTCKDETPRGMLAINHLLEGGEEFGHAVNLVQNGTRWKMGSEPYRVCGRSPAVHFVIKGEVGVSSLQTHPLGKGCLSALPRSVDQNRGGILQGFHKRAL
jgi:hypothetical protein